MTITIKSEKVGKYLIEIYQEKYSVCFHVGLYYSFNDGIYRTFEDRTYTSLESAKRRYRTLVKNCQN